MKHLVNLSRHSKATTDEYNSVFLEDMIMEPVNILFKNMLHILFIIRVFSTLSHSHLNDIIIFQLFPLVLEVVVNLIWLNSVVA